MKLVFLFIYFYKLLFCLSLRSKLKGKINTPRINCHHKGIISKYDIESVTNCIELYTLPYIYIYYLGNNYIPNIKCISYFFSKVCSLFYLMLTFCNAFKYFIKWKLHSLLVIIIQRTLMSVRDFITIIIYRIALCTHGKSNKNTDWLCVFSSNLSKSQKSLLVIN